MKMKLLKWSPEKVLYIKHKKFLTDNSTMNNC